MGSQFKILKGLKSGLSSAGKVDGNVYYTTDESMFYVDYKDTNGAIQRKVLNADAANKLATARTITLKGDVSGSTTFDGSANAEITVVIADDSHNHIIGNVDGLQDVLNNKASTNVATTSASGLMSASDKAKLDNIEAKANAYSLPIATSSVLGGVKIGSNISISNGTISVPAATGSIAGVTVVYPAASCTTFSSDSGTVTPLAVQKGAKIFAITRPSSSTANAITRYSNTTGDVKDSKILIEDVTNTKDTSKTANVLSIPAEGGKKMVYGYCTDQIDGTSFIGGLFDTDATEFPYASGLAIGGSSGNLLWKGVKVATTSDNVASATKLATARDITVNLASESAASFDGTKAITPGVSGTLPISHGGTGATTAAAALTNLGITATATELNYVDGVTSNIQTQLNNKAAKSSGLFYIVGTGTTEGTWLGASDDITSYFDGLTVLYKVPVAGSSEGTTLNINSLGAVSVVRNATSAITTHFPVNSVLVLTYTTDSGTAYWKVADYDSNTKTTTSTTNKTGTKLFLAGATTQGSGKTTYSNSGCYVGTDNCLYSNGNVTVTADSVLHFSVTDDGILQVTY